MSLFEIFIIAVSLAMDALAVSASNGLALKNARVKHACIFGLYFGGFQFLMPVIGFLCGIGFGGYIEMVDHWIAFGLLSQKQIHQVGDGRILSIQSRLLF